MVSLAFSLSFIHELSFLHSSLSPRCVLPLGQACVMLLLLVSVFLWSKLKLNLYRGWQGSDAIEWFAREKKRGEE